MMGCKGFLDPGKSQTHQVLASPKNDQRAPLDNDYANFLLASVILLLSLTIVAVVTILSIIVFGTGFRVSCAHAVQHLTSASKDFAESLFFLSDEGLSC